MAEDRDRVVIEAHKLRRATVTAALLHGTRRAPRDLRRPYAAPVASLIVGAVLLVGLWAVNRIIDLL